MPAGRDGRGKGARGKGKGPVACHAENDQERSALDGQADRHRTRDVLCERMSEMNHNRNVAEQQARFAQKSGSEYDRVLAEATRHLAEGRCQPAEAAFRKAIALNPAQPSAYYNLGCIYMIGMGRVAEAAPNFVRAAALHLEGTVEWAGYISTAFETLADPECREVAKPVWWNDKDLMALSKTVTRVQTYPYPNPNPYLLTLPLTLTPHGRQARPVGAGEGARPAKRGAWHSKRAGKVAGPGMPVPIEAKVAASVAARATKTATRAADSAQKAGPQGRAQRVIPSKREFTPTFSFSRVAL